MEHIAVQHDMNLAFESLARAASTLVLEFQLDLASATISLARRVRAASLAPASASLAAELGSVSKGMEALQARAGLLPHTDAIPGLDLAVAWTNTYLSVIRIGETNRQALAA